MRKINVLFSLYSLTAFLIIIERLSPTTSILLSPDDFIRLHELLQTVFFLSITVVLSFLFLQELTDNFQTLTSKGSSWWAGVLFLGTYLFGAGEGWHEVASFTLNTYCDPDNLVGTLCRGLFINDFYAGNIIFFIGGVMMNTALLILAAKRPVKSFNNRDMAILVANSVVYAFTWFAYAAFDTVGVGLFFAAVLMVISGVFFWKIRQQWRAYPYLTHGALAYTLATVATVIVRWVV
jgi:hypothetical protein